MRVRRLIWLLRVSQALDVRVFLRCASGMLKTVKPSKLPLIPTSTVIAAEKLSLVKLENVIRLDMAESSTPASLYQHWLAAKEVGQSVMKYAGHERTVSELVPNGLLPYLMDTPSTKEAVDRTIDAGNLVAPSNSAGHVKICQFPTRGSLLGFTSVAYCPCVTS